MSTCSVCTSASSRRASRPPRRAFAAAGDADPPPRDAGRHRAGAVAAAGRRARRRGAGAGAAALPRRGAGAGRRAGAAGRGRPAMSLPPARPPHSPHCRPAAPAGASPTSDKPIGVPGQAYLVGGAVRDALLGRAVQRPRLGGGRRHAAGRCSTPASARSARDFPVFLHPHTQRGIRAGAHRAQDRARLPRLRRPCRPVGHAGAGPVAPRPDDQRDGHARRRRADRPLRRRSATCATACCAMCRRPSPKTRCASCAWRASRRASPTSASRPKRWR